MGKVYVGVSVEEFRILAEEIVNSQVSYELMSSNGCKLAKSMFSKTSELHQIFKASSDNYFFLHSSE